MKFGEYLVMTKMATEEDIQLALETQRQAGRPFGKCARNIGFLNKKQNIRILLEQLRTQQRYGEIAVKLGFLTEEQVDLLLTDQRKGSFPLGKILIAQTDLTRKDLAMALKNFVLEDWKNK
ncbi:MAG: hypothetical protein KKE17_12645 [Proteobacteria bacterium]|nr:hypothetical protein [Pseudomonadota bacterium]